MTTVCTGFKEVANSILISSLKRMLNYLFLEQQVPCYVCTPSNELLSKELKQRIDDFFVR
jgi:hypothetical protein